MDNILNGKLPMGFALHLMQNEQALQKFEAMDDAQKRKVIDGTHNIHSKQEMREYVNNLTR